MTPQGAWVKINKDLTKLARSGDLSDLRDYLAGDVYFSASVLVQPMQRLALIRCIARVMRQCYRRTVPRPPKQGFWDAAAVAQFKASWARHKGDHYRVARDLGITPGAARAAYSRFVVAGATPSHQNPPRKAQEARSSAESTCAAGRNAAPVRLPQAA
jgi:hypothetical protein